MAQAYKIIQAVANTQLCNDLLMSGCEPFGINSEPVPSHIRGGLHLAAPEGPQFVMVLTFKKLITVSDEEQAAALERVAKFEQGATANG